MFGNERVLLRACNICTSKCFSLSNTKRITKSKYFVVEITASKITRMKNTILCDVTLCRSLSKFRTNTLLPTTGSRNPEDGSSKFLRNIRLHGVTSQTIVLIIIRVTRIPNLTSNMTFPTELLMTWISIIPSNSVPIRH